MSDGEEIITNAMLISAVVETLAERHMMHFERGNKDLAWECFHIARELNMFDLFNAAVKRIQDAMPGDP